MKRGIKMFKRILMPIVVIQIFFALSFPVYTAEKGKFPPKVTGTNPQNGSLDVDPSLKEISVTFKEPMMDRSWSWSFEDRSKFPQITGDPYYADDQTRCVLPVKLEPNREYVIWINTATFKNFKSKAGIPAVPYKFSFKTR